MDILLPLVAEDHPDRMLWCEFAMQAEFLLLAQRAKELGWAECEIAVALVNLADQNLLAIAPNDYVADELSCFTKKK
jgi:hypothetical protein